MIDVVRYQEFQAAWLELSPQQRRIIEHRCRGLHNREVGQELYIAEMTVKNAVTAALARLHPVVRGARHGRRGAMEHVCWRIGYESAVRDLARDIAARKGAA